MKYFISPSGEVFAFESDGSQDSYIRGDLMPLSDAELAAIRAKDEMPPALTYDQHLQEANAKRDELMAAAGLKINPLQDALDLGKASSEDEDNLKLWKEYRLDVSLVTNQPGFPSTIKWPKQPEK